MDAGVFQRIKWVFETQRLKASSLANLNFRTVLRGVLLFVFAPFLYLVTLFKLDRLAIRVAKFLYRPIKPYAVKISRFVKQIRKEFARAPDEIMLMKQGFEYRPDAVDYIPVPQRALYLTYNSLPYHSAGYATRTQGLLAGVNANGFHVDVVTRLGYPQIFSAFRDKLGPDREDISGVTYHRLKTDVSKLFSYSTSEYLERNIDAIIELVKQEKPVLIHAASNFKNGLTANAVARACGIPSVFEVRGLWEVTAMSRDPDYENTFHFRQQKKLETQACMDADKVITLTAALKGELVRRGVNADKISVVPNGVDTTRFGDRPKNCDLMKRLNIPSDHIVIGYVGSILEYEGVDDMLRAVAKCRSQGLENFTLLLVGSGAYLNQCKALSDKLNLSDCVIFAGRVPFKMVDDYYSLIDITPFPRKALPVCELVSPLKPFEAMAMGKCLIVSDVGALAEIVQDGALGYMFAKGNVDDFADKIMAAVSDFDQRRAFGELGRKHVETHHDWSVLSQKVIDIYVDLLGVHGMQPQNEAAQ